MNIYYACSCGFRTFFPDEVDVHLAEVEQDGNQHNILSVLVDKGGDS